MDGIRAPVDASKPNMLLLKPLYLQNADVDGVRRAPVDASKPNITSVIIECRCGWG